MRGDEHAVTAIGLLLCYVVLPVAIVLTSLLVLPSLPLLITPSRKGEERDALIDSVTHGDFEYEPHSRETAVRDGSSL